MAEVFFKRIYICCRHSHWWECWKQLFTELSEIGKTCLIWMRKYDIRLKVSSTATFQNQFQSVKWDCVFLLSPQILVNKPTSL